jgi:hypothetical protein
MNWYSTEVRTEADHDVTNVGQMQWNWARMKQEEFHVLHTALLGAATVDEEVICRTRLKRREKEIRIWCWEQEALECAIKYGEEMVVMKYRIKKAKLSL